MERLQSRPSGPTSRKYSHPHASYGLRGRDSPAKNRRSSLKTDAGPLAEVGGSPIRNLGDGPAPPSRETKYEFIQSWLQQTQGRYSRLSEPGYDKGGLQLAERSRHTARPDRRRKRSRSLSEPPPPSPKATEHVEYRFGKRARHKTREDKYDYKVRAEGKKRVPERELRGRSTKGGARKRGEPANDTYSVVRQVPKVSTASHMVRRASRSIPKTSRISESLTRRGAQPCVSKSRLNKSQKEDRELEELSAFFSRKTPFDEVRAKESGFANYGSQLRSVPIDVDSNPRSKTHMPRTSFHGSHRSYRSITIGEAEAASRQPGSPLAIRSRNTEPAPLDRLSSKPKSSFAESWHNGHNSLAEDEPGSYRSRGAHPGGTFTGIARDTLERYRESEPGMPGRPGRGLVEAAWRTTIGTRRDSAVQTCLTPQAVRKPSKERQQLDEHEALKTGFVEDEGRHAGLFNESTREGPRLLVGGGVEDRSIPAQDLPRYAAHVELDAGHHQDSDGLLAAGRTFWNSTFPSDRPTTYFPRPNRTDRSGHGTARNAGSFLDHPAVHWGHLGFAGQQLDIHTSFHQTEDPDDIVGNFGFENLEEFIRRIEGEAALTYGRAEHDCAIPPMEFGVRDCPAVRPLEVGNFDCTNDAAVVSSRDWFPLEDDPSGCLPAGKASPMTQEAGFTCPTSLSMLPPYVPPYSVEEPETL